jgi:hypothetical protein
MQPLAALVAAGKIEPGARVSVEPGPAGDNLTFHVAGPGIFGKLHTPAVPPAESNREPLRMVATGLAPAARDY